MTLNTTATDATTTDSLTLGAGFNEQAIAVEGI